MGRGEKRSLTGGRPAYSPSGASPRPLRGKGLSGHGHPAAPAGAALRGGGQGAASPLLLPHDPERPEEVIAFADPFWEEVCRRAGEGRALELLLKAHGDAGSGQARLARCLYPKHRSTGEARGIPTN